MCMLECFFLRRRQQQWIDVLVDIDDTLVYAGEGTLNAPELMCSYRLAHGALEFLIALDRIPGIRIGFYSCGAKLRNETLIKLIAASIKSRGHSLTQDFAVYSVEARMYGKKCLAGLRSGINLTRAILVDDAAVNIEAGEEAKLLKVYASKHSRGALTPAQKVYQARLANNLIRALGIILMSIEMSKLYEERMSVVQALKSLQWDGEKYLHDSSNSEEIYQCGLQAMRDVQPDFMLALDHSSTYPWSAISENDESSFLQQRHEITHDYYGC